MKKIIFIILVILFYSCSDDDLLNEQISSAQPASTIIPITKAKYSYDTQKNNLFIQQKAPKFYQRFSPKSADASSITLSWGTIKTDEALEVQEVNGYTTTTYKIEPYEKQDDELYNLVFISKDTLVSAHVYGYKMDETFKTNYHENGESLANFSGQIVSQEIIMEEDRISNIDCVEFINDLLNDQNGGNTGGGSSGSGTSPGGSPSGGGSTAGATDWFDSVPVFEDEAPSTSDPIDWSWVGDVGGAIVDAGGEIGSFFGDIWSRIKDLFSGCGCGVNGRPAPSSSKSIVENDYKEVVYVVIDLDEEHDCYPLAIGIIGDTLSPEYIEDLFGMSMEDFENVRDNHPQLFIDMMDVVMQGDFNANRISLFRNLSLALLDDSVSEENIENILLFLSENNTDEGVAFALELLVIMVENPDFNPDFELSYKSPYNIDLTEVTPSETNPEPEKERFMEIYNAVTTSTMFKNLIQQTFDENERLNVTFEIVNSLPSASGGKANGKAVLNMGTLNQTEGSENLDITIQINKERLIGAYATSKIAIARTIMHEYIHAYLYVKLFNANLGATLEDLNNNDLAESLNEYNLALNNDNLQAQHEFMFDKMVPTISSNLAQILNILVPANHRTGAEGTVFNYTINNIKDPRNESNVVSITLPGNPWSWNDFYYYFSLEGLQNTDAFYNTIWLSENHVLYGLYSEYLNVGNNLFN